MAFGTETSHQCPSRLLLILALTHAALSLGPTVRYPVSYHAVKKGGNVTLMCSITIQEYGNTRFKWYQVLKETSEKPREVSKMKCFEQLNTYRRQTELYLTFRKVQMCLSGIYHCTMPSNNSKISGCGIELEVVEATLDLETLKHQSAMKDMLILAQGVLLFLCLSLPAWLFFKRDLDGEFDEDGEDMDHMYEGLEVLQSAMYEDIGNVRLTSKKMSAGEKPHQ